MSGWYLHYHPTFAFFLNKMDKETLIRELAALSEADRNHVLQQIQKQTKRLETPKKFMRGYRLEKKSSSECSQHQREIYLGAGGSGLLRCNAPFEDGVLAGFDQVAKSKYGTWCFSSSKHISCSTTEIPTNTLLEVSTICGALYETNKDEQTFIPSGIGRLSKNLSMRDKAMFSKLPINDVGQLLLQDPYYPNREPTPYFLPAVPWQRILQVLGIASNPVSWLLDTEPPTLVLSDSYHLATIPLQRS